MLEALLEALSSVRDSTLLFGIALVAAAVAAVFALTIGPGYAMVIAVLAGGSGFFGVLRRREGD